MRFEVTLNTERCTFLMFMFVYVCVRVLFLSFLFISGVFWAQGGDRCVFDKFLVTNSIPTTTDRLPKNDVYVVLDLVHRVKDDLDLHSSI